MSLQYWTSVLERKRAMELVYIRFLYYRGAILDDLSDLSDDDDISDVSLDIDSNDDSSLESESSVTIAANALGASLRYLASTPPPFSKT